MAKEQQEGSDLTDNSVLDTDEDDETDNDLKYFVFVNMSVVL